MPKVQHHKDRNRNIRRQKVRNGPIRLYKDLKPVGEREKRHDAEDEVCEVRLERCAVGKFGEHVVEDHGFAEADVGDHDDDPGDEARDGGDVGEPGEDLGAGAGYVEVGQEANGPGGQYSGPWHALLGRFAEELGRVAVESHAVEDTGTRVEEGVAGGPGGCQDCCVDNMV